MKTAFYTYQSHLHCIGARNKKAENPLRPNQKLATSLDLSCRDNLSAISAMNSEFVGLPFVLETVYPKNLCRVSRSPRSQATSMAWRMARSTLEGVVWNVSSTMGNFSFSLIINAKVPLVVCCYLVVRALVICQFAPFFPNGVTEYPK